MRHLTILAALLFGSLYMQAQTYEIGPYLGGANYIGDIGSTTYINPNTVLGGFVFKWNRSKRHAFRLSVLHTNIKANDAKASTGKRVQRGLRFENSITEVSLGLEFTFWDWDLHSFKPQMVPYLYTGLTFFNEEGATIYDKGGTKSNKFNGGWSMSLPFVLGVKGTLSNHWVLAIEVGPRYTFLDNIDGKISRKKVNWTASEVDGSVGLSPNMNDWYMFTGVSLTYTFGRKPCYCNF